MYNLEPIPLSSKNDKNFISKITIRRLGLLVTFLSEYMSQQKIKHHFQFQV